MLVDFLGKYQKSNNKTSPNFYRPKIGIGVHRTILSLLTAPGSAAKGDSFFDTINELVLQNCSSVLLVGSSALIQKSGLRIG